MTRWLIKKAGLHALGNLLRGVAEGDYGPKWQAFYLSLAGRKRAIGFAFLLVCTIGTALHGDPGTTEFITGSLAGVFIAAGALDKDWRTVPAEISSSRLVRLAHEHRGDIAGAATAALAALAGCQPELAALLARVHAWSWVLTCSQAYVSVVVMVAVLSQLGIDVRQAEPPRLAKG